MNEYTSDIPDERTALLANQDPAIQWLIDQCKGRYWLFVNSTTIELLTDQITFFVPYNSIMSVHSDIRREGIYFSFRIELRDSKGFASMNMRYTSPSRAHAAQESLLDFCRHYVNYQRDYASEQARIKTGKVSANDDDASNPVVLTHWQKLCNFFQTTLSLLRK